jgi:hypothetical protein
MFQGKDYQRLLQPETLRDPPGLFAAANYETLTLRLLAGDSVLFSTDGISDAFSRKEEQFGSERLQELCDANGRWEFSEIAFVLSAGNSNRRGLQFFSRCNARCCQTV